MDPFSFAASVGHLSGVCISTVKRLSEIAAKLKDAPKIIQDVSSEAKIITISLSLLHNILVSDEHTILAKALLTPDIRNALDIALTGCSVTLSCIKNEIHSLTSKIDTEQKLNLADRAKVVWKDNKFNELLQQLRRQHNAISILQQGLQMKALADIVPLLKNNRLAIQEVADGTESLRGLYPEVNAAKSFLESFASSNKDEPTFSIVSERQFEFDDVITNSQAYRRVLVAATQTLRSRQSGNLLANGDSHDPGLQGGILREENSTPGAQGANQARKISAASPSRTGIPPSQDKVSQSGINRRTTISDPVNFVQQLRGYVDRVEGELMSATDETTQLREMLQEKDKMVKALEASLQLSAERTGTVELQLKQAMTEIEVSDQEFKSLTKVFERMNRENKELKREVGAQEHLRAEMEDKHKREVAHWVDLFHKTEAELKSTTEKLDATQKEKDSAREAFIATKCSLETEVENYIQHVDELKTYYRNIRQKLTVECKRLEEKSRNSEESIHKGNTTQVGSVLLIPLQSPAWLGGTFERHRIFQGYNVPATPEGWVSQWVDQQHIWSFVNQYTKEVQFEMPTSPAVNPLKLHTASSSSVSSSTGSNAESTNRKPNTLSKTPALTGPQETNSLASSSNGTLRPTSTSPTPQEVVTSPKAAGSIDETIRATTTSPIRQEGIVHPGGPDSDSKKKKRKSKLPFT